MFHAQIIEGKLSFGPVIRQQVKEWLAVNEGKRVAIHLVKHHRSGQQNRYYWLYLGVIERETGNNADDIHEWAKRKFLPPRFITVNGEEIKITASTTDLNKNDFTEYLDKISAATEIPLPDPEAAGFYTR
jgi:hypothetical protein